MTPTRAVFTMLAVTVVGGVAVGMGLGERLIAPVIGAGWAATVAYVFRRTKG